MQKLFKIVKDNQKSLRQKCVEVNPIDEETIKLVNDMHDYLVLTSDEEFSAKHNTRPGVGLAAPQIGKNIRALAIYYIDYDSKGNEVVIDHRLINPKIISESVREIYISAGEGCLSVDDAHDGYIYRKYKIMVKAFDAKQRKEVVITARGYEAVVLQHELDHLDGILFYDRINKKNPFLVKEDAVRI